MGSALPEQVIVLRNDPLVTEACHLVLVRGDRPKENTRLFARTSLAFLLTDIHFVHKPSKSIVGAPLSRAAELPSFVNRSNATFLTCKK